MNVKQNLKYRETHKAIMDALLELLQTKNIKQVTVSEICRKVHINRSTFYEHFTDVYDVLEKIMDDIAAEVPHEEPPTGPLQREDFLRLLYHIRKYKTFFILFFRQGLPLDLQEKFFLKRPAHPAPEVLAALGITTPLQFEYCSKMAYAAAKAMIVHWLERDCAETPEELCDILEHMMRGDRGQGDSVSRN